MEVTCRKNAAVARIGLPPQGRPYPACGPTEASAIHVCRVRAATLLMLGVLRSVVLAWRFAGCRVVLLLFAWFLFVMRTLLLFLGLFMASVGLHAVRRPLSHGKREGGGRVHISSGRF